MRQWLAEDPRHAAAFQAATHAWRRSGEVPVNFARQFLANAPRQPRAKYIGPLLAGAAVLCGLLVSAAYFLADPALVTGPGERRTLELSDGTQVSLNANSRLLLQYDDHVRKLTLAAGEALFNVSKHQSRPFIVVMGDRKVIAVGTSFLVRREEVGGSVYAVTLVEGRVAVEPVGAPDTMPNGGAPGLKLLSPGERLSFSHGASEKVDSPPLDRITAWQHGRLIFDDTSLSEAAAEFNRYGSRTIDIDSARMGALRVGGVFRIGDPLSFAHAMAAEYHLRVVDRGDRILLTDKDQKAEQ